MWLDEPDCLNPNLGIYFESINSHDLSGLVHIPLSRFTIGTKHMQK